MKCWQGCGEKGMLIHRWWEYKLVQPMWKTVWKFLKKLRTELPYYSAIPLLGIYLKKTKTLIWKDTCTPLFIETLFILLIAVLFIIAKTWNQPKCPSTYEWIKKCGIHTHVMKYYSAIKEWNNAFCSNVDGIGGHYAKWNKSEKDKYHIT